MSSRAAGSGLRDPARLVVRAEKFVDDEPIDGHSTTFEVSVRPDWSDRDEELVARYRVWPEECWDALAVTHANVLSRVLAELTDEANMGKRYRRGLGNGERERLPAAIAAGKRAAILSGATFHVWGIGARPCLDGMSLAVTVAARKGVTAVRAKALVTSVIREVVAQ